MSELRQPRMHLLAGTTTNISYSQATSSARVAQRISSIHSTASGDSLERASVIVRPTDEKSISDWAEVAVIQSTLLATSDSAGKSLAFCLQKSRGVLWLAGCQRFVASQFLASRRTSFRCFCIRRIAISELGEWVTGCFLCWWTVKRHCSRLPVKQKIDHISH